MKDLNRFVRFLAKRLKKVPSPKATSFGICSLLKLKGFSTSTVELIRFFCCVFEKQFVTLHKECDDMAQNKFQIVFMDEAKNFVKSIPAPAREKLYYNFDKVSCGFSSSELFKKLDGDSDLYEFRTLYNGLQYRFLAFWDEQKKRLVVVTHGFVKKTWKIPAKEIERAKSLRNKYYESK